MTAGSAHETTLEAEPNLNKITTTSQDPRIGEEMVRVETPERVITMRRQEGPNGPASLVEENLNTGEVTTTYERPGEPNLIIKQNRDGHVIRLTTDNNPLTIDN